MTVYSYSAIKSYSTCPRQYHHRYVLKDLPPVDWDTPALRKGREVHEALERAVLEGNDAPELGPHTFWTPPALLSKLHKAGARAEVRMAIREDGSPCDFFAKDARFRGVIDVHLRDPTKGRSLFIDWKTGKFYPDPLQADCYAALERAEMPGAKVEFYWVFGEARKLHVERPDARATERVLAVIETIEQNQEFNPRPNFSCRWCAVASCAYNTNPEV